MSDTGSPQPTLTGFAVRQGALAAVFAICLWLGLGSGVCEPGAGPHWPAALVGWLAMSMFFFGWRTTNLKLVFYLACAWVGVASVTAVLVILVGSVATVGSVWTTRIFGGLALLAPLWFLPRTEILWPGNNLPSGIAGHGLRALFIVLQYVAVAALIAALGGQCPEPPPS